VDVHTRRPRTAFYHPWSDTFWLAEWSLDPKPRVVKGWFGAGDVLRSGGKPPWEATPLWLRGHGPRADALAKALAESIPAAERALRSGSWRTVRSKRPERDLNLTLCRMPLLELLVGLEPLRRSVDGEDAAVAALRRDVQALRSAAPAKIVAQLRDAPENTAESREALQTLPPALASTLRPICRLGAGRTAVVVMMPSQISDVALATVWEARSSGARLLREDVLPFAHLLKAAQAEARRR
jgi:hypothetical protein